MLLLVVAWLAIIEDAAAIRFVSASRDQTSRIWNSASSNTEAAKPIKQGGNVLSAALNTDGRLIATGSTVSVPPVKGLLNAPYWTSDDILDLDFLPKKVIVLGGGIVACELAQFLSRIGSTVIQIQRSPQILKEASPEAASVIETTFRSEGIELYTDTKLESITHSDTSFTVRFSQAGKITEVVAPHLLNALGREPATDNLGLEVAGIETKVSGHVIYNEMQQTTNPKVSVCGDAAGPHEIVHVAIMQGELAAKYSTGQAASPVDYNSLLGVIFTDPQIGSVGLSEAQLKAQNIDYLCAEYPFDDHGKSILMEAKHGYVKVMADKSSGVILGAECVSKDGGELIHSMAVAVTIKASVKDLLKVHWYHPTLSEIWSYPLEDIQEELEG